MGERTMVPSPAFRRQRVAWKRSRRTSTKLNNESTRLTFNMYLRHKMTEAQREDTRRNRRAQRYRKHSPPHFDPVGETSYLITAACYEHKSIIGKSADRLSDLEKRLLAACESFSTKIFAWSILLNRYHVCLRTERLKELRSETGKLHGRTSFEWNGEDGSRGRQVWHNCFEKPIKCPRQHYAMLNYVLQNPVHHRLTGRWRD